MPYSKKFSPLTNKGRAIQEVLDVLESNSITPESPAISGGGGGGLSWDTPTTAPTYTQEVGYVTIGSTGDYATIEAAHTAGERKFFLLAGETHTVDRNYVVAYNDEFRIVGEDQTAKIDLATHFGGAQFYQMLQPATSKDVGTVSLTLSGAVTAGATTINVTDTTGLAIGDYVRVLYPTYEDSYEVWIPILSLTGASVTFAIPVQVNIASGGTLMTEYQENVVKTISIKNVTCESTVNDGNSKTYIADTGIYGGASNSAFFLGGDIQDVICQNMTQGGFFGSHDLWQFTVNRCTFDWSGGAWLAEIDPPKDTAYIDCVFKDRAPSSYDGEGQIFQRCQFLGDMGSSWSDGGIFLSCYFENMTWRIRPEFMQNCTFGLLDGSVPNTRVLPELTTNKFFEYLEVGPTAGQQITLRSGDRWRVISCLRFPAAGGPPSLGAVTRSFNAQQTIFTSTNDLSGTGDTLHLVIGSY